MLLDGKRGLVLGIANKRSIAWGIAQAAQREGARLALTYQGERLGENVRELAQALNEPLLLPCDVTRDEEISAAFRSVGRDLGGLDILVHSVAFAPREDLERPFVETSRGGYLLSQAVSAFSLAALAREAAGLMESGGSIITLTYIGGERVIPRYNVMGVAKAALESSVRYLAHDLGPRRIRVNAISAGPIKTMAARGIVGFGDIFDVVAERSPLKRNIEPKEVAGAALFLASDLSSGITGEVIHVDCGYHVMGI